MCEPLWEQVEIDRKKQVLQRAKVRLEKELNMIELLKSRRFFYEAMKVLLTKD